MRAAPVGSLLALLGVLVLSTCAVGACAPGPTPRASSRPAESPGCVGAVEPPDGLKETDDPPLLAEAIRAPGKGGLCTAKVFQVVRPLTVYRVWSRDAPSTRLGRWWSFGLPQGPVESYRAKNAICPEWSELDMLVECKLKVGAEVVVGPGQSADCDGRDYAASATNQAYVPYDTRDSGQPVLHVGACTAGTTWP